ncbi:MAG TPA: hypothetical protein VEP90_15780 [Methylomirabilota bacterium]|nr:hypothetical protein [Methylomirabilota bacterium]
MKTTKRKKKTVNPLEQFKPGSLGCHEVFHVSCILTTWIDHELCQHPAIQANPKWLKMAQTAEQILADLYQDIGQKHCAAVR